jgi:hypothetical protein
VLVYPSGTCCCKPPAEYFELDPGDKAALDMEMALLTNACANRATQTMTEATVASVQETLPAIQRAAISWWCATKGEPYDGKAVPPRDYTPISKAYRAMLKKVLGDLLLKLEVVYLCPRASCNGHRRTRDHTVPCVICGANYVYEDKHGKDGVCTLRYYPMATLIRYVFADPLKARHLGATFKECVAEPDAMSGVYGESRHTWTNATLIVHRCLRCIRLLFAGIYNTTRLHPWLPALLEARACGRKYSDVYEQTSLVPTCVCSYICRW